MQLDKALLDVRPTLQPLHTGDLISLLGDDAAQSRNLTKQITHQSNQLGRGQTVSGAPNPRCVGLPIEAGPRRCEAARRMAQAAALSPGVVG